MIFLDTSAIYALADRSDPRHREAVGCLDSLLAQERGLLTHNYVLVEAMALLQHRLGIRAALKLAESAPALDLVWVERPLHEEAVRRLGASPRRRVSLVDHVSFLVMKSWRVDTAFAFDPDFAREGFRLLPS